MRYLVTFDDGSSAFLAHHGVKGMKWGKWNKETRERYQAEGLDLQGGGGGGVDEEEEDEKDTDDHELTKEEKEQEAADKQRKLEQYNREHYKNYAQNTSELVSQGKIYDALLEASAGSGATGEGSSGFVNALANATVDAVSNNENVKKARERVNDVISDTKHYSDAANNMSENELDQLRAKAKEDKRRIKEEKQRKARESGNPLWMLM